MRLPVYKHDDVVAWTIVDAGEYDRLSQYSWRLDWHGYVRRATGRRGVNLALHRDVLGLKPGDPGVVDHINRDKLDNRRANLRVGTHALNAQNRAKRSGVSSRFLGVTYLKDTGKWMAAVKLNGRTIYFGTFEREEEAGAVVAAFRAEHMPFSEEARLVA